MEPKIDVFELKLAAKPEYVSVARLTASGIAGRKGFNIDDIEDIKVSLSEICSKIVEAKHNSEYLIRFFAGEDYLSMGIECPGLKSEMLFDEIEMELAQAIISSLMDEVTLDTKDGYIAFMKKSLEG